MSTQTEKKPVTTGDPDFVNFCSFTALHTQIRLLSAYYEDQEQPTADQKNLLAALATSQHAIGYCCKLLANTIFEPNEPQNNG